VRRTFVPQPILDAAHARAAARVARDWATADRFRREIEAAGWRVIDSGTDFRLEPAHPPEEVDGDVIRHGRSDAVPSRLEEPSRGMVSVIVIATDQSDDLDRALGALGRTAPAETQVVVVADAPDAAQEARLPGSVAGRTGRLETEVVRTSARLGWAAALNIGLRRAVGPVVVFMDTRVELLGDALTPLVDVLRADDVAVAGPFGLRSADLRRFEAAPVGDAATIEGDLLAFRRADAAAAGGLDEGFRFYRNLDIWWSLVLRDRGAGLPPRRAVVVPDLAVARHDHRAWASTPEPERDRLSKRNFYRVLARFRGRPDLAVP
jgi:GT2 family glycosyltransferase